MINSVEQIRWTIDDLDTLPQSESNTYEIIGGELLVTRTPHRRHQQVCTKIASQLNIWSESTGLGETIIAPGVIFSEEDCVIPDLVWVSKQRLQIIEDESGHLTEAPELMIEVVSKGTNNEKRDYQTKLKLYSVQGVQEYWIVNRFVKQVQVYRREKAKLVLVATLLENDEIKSPLLPQFTCQIKGFFPE